MVIEEPPREQVAFATHNTHSIERWKDGAPKTGHEVVVEEVPIALVYNGISHAVMLATPEYLEDFALGFSLSEGIVRNKSEVYDIEVAAADAGIEVNLTIATACFVGLKERRRNLAGRTGCGLCGTESLEHAVRPVTAVPRGPTITPEVLNRAFEELGSCQMLHALTGAVHAAGWATSKGKIELVREDVGRHNALDKIIGAMARRRAPFDTGFAFLTSRASCEMVQKAAAVGITILAAISAPTGLAIRLAKDSGMTLIGFARNRAYVVYANAQRVRGVS